MVQMPTLKYKTAECLKVFFPFKKLRRMKLVKFANICKPMPQT